MPEDMAHSHIGVASDGRYIYVVSGQYGPQCRAPISRSFVLDTETKEWHSLPPLPLPRHEDPCPFFLGFLLGISHSQKQN